MYLVFWFGKFTTRSTSLSWISLQRNNNSESWKILKLKAITWRQRLEMHRNQHIFWLPILSFLQSQFTCKNWFAFVNNSVPWILITRSCGGDTHRSPGHPVGDAHNRRGHPIGVARRSSGHPMGDARLSGGHTMGHAHTSPIFVLYRRNRVSDFFRAAWFLEDFVRMGKHESPLRRKKLSLWIWRIGKTRPMIPHNNISAPSKILTL